MKGVLFLLFCLSLVLAGCTTVDSIAKSQFSFINYSATTYQPQQEDYPIDLFFEGEPQKEYQVIGDIEGFVYPDDNLRAILEAKARQIGADGIAKIETQQGYITQSQIVDVPTGRRYFTTTPVAEQYSVRVINIKGKAIKYK